MESPSILGSAVSSTHGVGGQPQEAAHAGDEVDHVLLAEGVAERQHRHGMAHLAEGRRRGRRRRAADGLSGAHQLRESAPRWRHCAGARRRSRRPRSRARLARNRAGRGGRSRARAARARPSPAASVSLPTGLLDAVVAFMRARLPPRATRNPDPIWRTSACQPLLLRKPQRRLGRRAGDRHVARHARRRHVLGRGQARRGRRPVLGLGLASAARTPG